LNVTLDVATGLVVSLSAGTGWLVYRWTQPPLPGSPLSFAPQLTGPPQHTKGERLVAALTAAVAVMVLGSYLTEGITGVARGEGAETKTDKAAVAPLDASMGKAHDSDRSISIPPSPRTATRAHRSPHQTAFRTGSRP